MERYAENVLVSIKVKLMECWADSVWPCIFHFWKCVTQGIKAPFGNKAADLVPPTLGLPMSFSLSLSLSLSSGWSPGAKRLSEFTFLPRLLTLSRRHSASLPHLEGTWGLRKQSKSHVRGFTGFLCKPRNISLLFSLYSFSFILLSFQPWTIRFQSSIRPMSSLSPTLSLPRVPVDPAGAGPQQYIKRKIILSSQ